MPSESDGVVAYYSGIIYIAVRALREQAPAIQDVVTCPPDAVLLKLKSGLVLRVQVKEEETTKWQIQ
jgi:hypothetical protein